MSENEKKSTTSTADQQAVKDAWNQVGIYMETAQQTWTRLAQRNFDFWKDVAGSLRTGPVTADTLAANTARAMSVAMETAQDLWLTAFEPAQREVYAQTLPTAFMYFTKNPDQSGGHDNPDPVHIPVNHQRETLADSAEITISGNPTDPKASASKALRALDLRLRANRDGSARSYLLEALNFDTAESKLIAGTYVGLIYLTGPPLPLANLRVVVE